METDWSKAVPLSLIVTSTVVVTGWLGLSYWLTAGVVFVLLNLALGYVTGVGGKQNSVIQSIEQNEGAFDRVATTLSSKTSGLAINSAEISFFLDQLANSIERSSSDIERLAAAAQQISANTQEITHNADVSSEQARSAQHACADSTDKLENNISVINNLNHSVLKCLRETRVTGKNGQ